MRIVKLALVALLAMGSLALFATSAHADSGGPATDADGRYNPDQLDRVALYQNADNTITIWGVDNLSAGHFLTTFTQAELTSKTTVTHQTELGTVTLTLDAPSTSHLGYMNITDMAPSVIIDTEAEYHVTWTGGPWGADGSAPFVKYLWAYYGV